MLTDTITVTATDGTTHDVVITINDANDTPATIGVGNINVNEDAPASTIDLFAAFDDAEDADTALTYTVTNNTNTALFSGIDSTGSTLSLAYTPDASGTANITLRATGSQGGYVETTFAIEVEAVNDAPTHGQPWGCSRGWRDDHGLGGAAASL
jgi:hypothetical protein